MILQLPAKHQEVLFRSKMEFFTFHLSIFKLGEARQKSAAHLESHASLHRTKQRQARWIGELAKRGTIFHLSIEKESARREALPQQSQPN